MENIFAIFTHASLANFVPITPNFPGKFVNLVTKFLCLLNVKLLVRLRLLVEQLVQFFLLLPGASERAVELGLPFLELIQPKEIIN